MRIAIPHNLDNDEVRRRLRSKSHQIGEAIPGGGAVTTAWPTEDRMTMDIGAMGESLRANVDLEPGQLVLNVDLPPALSFIEPVVAGAIRQQGQKLLT